MITTGAKIPAQIIGGKAIKTDLCGTVISRRGRIVDLMIDGLILNSLAFGKVSGIVHTTAGGDFIEATYKGFNLIFREAF